MLYFSKKLAKIKQNVLVIPKIGVYLHRGWGVQPHRPGGFRVKNKVMNKTIRAIAENAGFCVKITRHGIYTNYVITRNGAKYLIESIAPKGENKYYRFSSVNEFRNLTKYTVYHYDVADSFGMKHTLADGKWYAKLTFEEIQMLIDNN